MILNQYDVNFIISATLSRKAAAKESKVFGRLVRFALSYPPIVCFVMLTHNSHPTGTLPFPRRVAMLPQTLLSFTAESRT